MLPQKIKDAIITIDGVGYVGKTESITWPKLARKLEEYRGGGMSGTIKLDMGQEAMSMGFELAEHSPEILKNYGICSAGGVLLRINASAEADDFDCTNSAIEVIVRGRWSELDGGDTKSGDNSTLKVSMELTYFKYTLDGEELIEIDPVNNILISGGVDRLAERRNNLKL